MQSILWDAHKLERSSGKYESEQNSEWIILFSKQFS